MLLGIMQKPLWHFYCFIIVDNIKMNSKTKDAKNLPIQVVRVLNFQCKTIYKSTNSNIVASSESTSIWSVCSKAVDSKMSKKSTISPCGQFKSPRGSKYSIFPIAKISMEDLNWPFIRCRKPYAMFFVLSMATYSNHTNICF